GSHGAAGPCLVGGGWFGWLGFDGTARLAFYDHLLRWREGEWFFEALWSDERDALLSLRRDECVALLGGADVGAPWTVGNFGSADAAAHLVAVERAIEWIRDGEIYQANVCTRLAAAFTGSAVGLFAHAAGQLAPRFGAYIDGGDRELAGFSPELFLRRRGTEVTTSPIKGTWPRRPGDDPPPTTGSAAMLRPDGGSAALRASSKDTAENVMIVDLMRNDLGRVCEIGSVQVSALLDIEAHPGVWHLVSTVTGRLRAECDDSALLDATFPPGSVTGAPKLRALDAIGALEAVPRGVYTGALGFVSPIWGMELAVAIRTFEIADGRLELGVGGGVTADSVPMLEWRECLHKAAPLMTAVPARLVTALVPQAVAPTATQLAGGLLETVLLLDGAPVRLGEHLARLDRSARELFGRGVPGAIADQAREAALGWRGRGVLRIVLSPGGGHSVSCRPLGPPLASCEARTITGRDGLWRHKWADRSWLEGMEIGAAAALLVAPDGCVLETDRGNVFMLTADGALVTPPLLDGLLPGITRRALLDLARDHGRATELRCFDLAEMRRNACFWTSSLSGAVAINAIDSVVLPRQDEAIARLSWALISGGGRADR
ncbi:MAG: aminodeoxychorismate synthase component I, partial [Actinomycetota bacterium]|nr:aminodeoxychorismate synthase component I [Actinomycetota bacterium]